MGFCSGTRIFDDVMKVIRDPDELELSDGQEYTLIYVLMKSLEDIDWDCQWDSAYIDDPVVMRVMRALGHQVDDEDEE
jgi:hypothetical protein